MSAYKLSSTMQPSNKENEEQKNLIEKLFRICNEINFHGVFENVNPEDLICLNIDEYTALKSFRESKYNFTRERVNLLKKVLSKAFK
jgi:hypothetical protein